MSGQLHAPAAVPPGKELPAPWRSVGYIVDGPRHHSNSWFRVPSEQMTIIFFSRLLRVFIWDLLFNDRTGLTSSAHVPSAGVGSGGHLLTGHLHTPASTIPRRIRAWLSPTAGPDAAEEQTNLLSLSGMEPRSQGRGGGEE